MSRYRIILYTEDNSKENAMSRVMAAIFGAGIHVSEVKVEEVKELRSNTRMRPLKEWAFKLRNSPGKWEVLEEMPEGESRRAANLAYNIKHGKIQIFRPAGSFDSYTSKDPITEVTRVWAAYVGEGGNKEGRPRR